MLLKKFCKTTLIVLSILWVLGCDNAQLTPISASATILAFGDSLTYGKGVNEGDSYPSVLARLTNREVVNAGISGELTKDGLARLGDVLAEFNPELLILLEGGNDILRNQNLAKTKQNLASMIELAQAQGIQVVLIGVPEKKLFSNSASLFSELAKQYHLAYDGELIASLLRSPKYKSDSVHFNEKGYRKMAKAIFALLKENNAL